MQLLEEDGMEGEAFEAKNNEELNLKNDVLVINVQKLFDLFLGKMSDIEKFFVLIEIGCLEKYATMTVSQFSVAPVFLNIVSTDPGYAKNIRIGDVVIKRPDRHSYTDRDIALKDVGIKMLSNRKLYLAHSTFFLKHLNMENISLMQLQ